MTHGPPEDPLAYLDANPDLPVDLAMDLLAFDTRNPPGATDDLVAWLADEFETLDLATETVAVDPAKPNLLATLPGESDRVLCFNGHLDTVPVDADEWRFDPLGDREGDRVYGRGATDMKGAVAAMLATARAYVATDTTPPVTLLFALVSDEEIGGDAGLPSLLEGGHLDADACVIGEPTCEQGRHSVTVADRGSIWLTLAAAGESAHGSRPMLGDNAIDRLYDGVETLRERFGERPLDLSAEVEAIVDESVAYYGPIMGEDVARRLFDYPSINLGTIEGGDAINTVPQHATAEVDIRLTAGVETGDVLADVRACADDCEGVHIADVSWSVGSAVPVDAPIVDAVASLAAEVTADRIYRRSATGGGDAKDLRETGIPTVEFALATDTAHAVDEYTTVEILRKNARIYAQLPDAFAERLAE
jgi:succinyl-diaminopimelate desuccinylase